MTPIGSTPGSVDPDEASDARLDLEALRALLVDPVGVGGALLRVRPGPHLDAWLAAIRRGLPVNVPVRKVPAHVDPARLAAETDVISTLANGRRTPRPGLLAEADGGLVLVPMAERMEPGVAALLAEALDTGRVAPREAGFMPESARIAAILMDESRPDERGAPRLLAERAGLQFALEPTAGSARLALGPVQPGATPSHATPRYAELTRERVAEARERLPRVEAGEAHEQAVVEVSVALGIASLRPAQHALATARARAAFERRTQVSDDDLAVAVALVLMPRATRLPVAPAPEDDTADPSDAPPPPPPSDPDDAPASDDADDRPVGRLADRVVEAARARLPDDVPDTEPGAGFGGGGRRGALIRQLDQGHRVGARPGDPRRGGRIDIAATLRSAAPWQRARRSRAEARAQSPAPAGPPAEPTPAASTRRLFVERDDLHVQIRARRSATATIFLVDASGSQAMNRLAEVKGAVELFLADSYVRREQVALVAFRGREAELALPATRSLVRARRTLAGMIGGGGTPLALGLLEGLRLALRLRSDALSPRLVLLSDGRPNVDREGQGGRVQARADALEAARLIRSYGLPGLVLDTSPRGEAFASELANALAMPHLHLPRTDARHVRAALSVLDAR